MFHCTDIFYPENYLKRLLNGELPLYSDIYFWNSEKNFYNFLKYYLKCGHSCKLHLYADAIGGYIKDQPDVNEKCRFWGGAKGIIYNFIDQHVFHIFNVAGLDYDYYLFKPELFLKTSKRKLIRIPDITKKDVPILNEVFEFRYEGMEQKYIFLDTARERYFEEVIQVICFIAEIVGKDQLAVKVHPRGNPKPYKKLGVKVMDDGIPWELYCMNGMDEQKVIIAPITSAAVLPFILMEKRYRVICVTDLIPNSYSDFQGLYAFFKKISEMEQSISMVSSFEQLRQNLEKENCHIYL